MDRIDIALWDALRESTWDILLLGNGASIAIHKEFAYPTLHSVDDAKELLATTAPIFAKLGASDFECGYHPHAAGAGPRGISEVG